jgi:hypothetical protein
MTFENIEIFPIILSVLLILFVIYFFYVYIKNNKKIISLIFLTTSLTFVIISLFSPRYWNYNQEIIQEWWNILFVLDVSKSMNVYDIWFGKKIISRLHVQKLMIHQFIENNLWNNYSLFAFAWETLELLPFTDDTGLFQTILNWVDQNNISKYGSDFEWLFQIVSNYVESEENAGTIVIFTDGWEIENLSLAQSLIQKLDKHNSQVIFVWIWSQKWWYIIDGEDLFWRPVYKIYNWNKVLSKLNKSWINKISDKYNFKNWFIDSDKNLNRIEDLINEWVDKQDFETNISLSRDISYIFIILFTIFFSLFLIIENKKTK